MSRKVQVSRTLTIRGQELDCLIHCAVDLFNDETGNGAELDINKVEVDAKDGAEISQADWPENLNDLVSDAACEAAREQDADDSYDDLYSRAED